jgi:putative acetyltransferase
MLRIIPGNLRDPRVVDLLHRHLTRARAETAPGSLHALDLAGLQSPNISFWTVWDDDKLLGIGALKQLSRRGEDMMRRREFIALLGGAQKYT